MDDLVREMLLFVLALICSFLWTLIILFCFCEDGIVYGLDETSTPTAASCVWMTGACWASTPL